MNKEIDVIFPQIEGILKQYLPHSYSEPEYVNDIATELIDWVVKHIEDKQEEIKNLKAKYSADVSYLTKMANEELKDCQDSLCKAGMVVMKDGKVVNLEDFFIL